MATSPPFVDMISCQFGPNPQRFHVKPGEAGFGKMFPRDEAALKRMAPAMRREAALLAREAGLPRPSGSLPVDSIVPLHRAAEDDDAIGGAREDLAAVDAMEAFTAGHLEDEPDAVLTLSALTAALATWAARQSIPMPSPTAIGRFLNARWERFRSGRAGAGTNWRGVRLKAG